MIGKKKLLFYFTKQFPFGTDETYIPAELSCHSGEFDKVIVIPGDFFDNTLKSAARPIPQNAEVLDLNKLASDGSRTLSTGRKFSLFFSVFADDFLRSKKKNRFLRNLSRYLGMLYHQALCASVFSDEIRKYNDFEKFYYTFWCHNSCIMLGLLKKQKVIKHFVSRAHALDLYHDDWKSLKGDSVLQYRHFKFNQLSALFASSKDGETYLKNKFPEIAEKVSCQFLGVNSNGINPFQESSPEFVLLSCSSLSSRKRVHLIAEILSHLALPVRWIHFGEGQEMEKIRKRCEKLPPNILVELKGKAGNREILDFYKSHPVNLFINTSEAEGMPVAIMEAMSFGIPVMATAVNGNPEVANRLTGFSIPAQFNSKQVALQIEEFAANVEFQKKIRASAREFFEKNFWAEKIYKKFAGEIKRYSGT